MSTIEIKSDAFTRLTFGNNLASQEWYCDSYRANQTCKIMTNDASLRFSKQDEGYFTLAHNNNLSNENRTPRIYEAAHGSNPILHVVDGDVLSYPVFSFDANGHCVDVAYMNFQFQYTPSASAAQDYLPMNIANEKFTHIEYLNNRLITQFRNLAKVVQKVDEEKAVLLKGKINMHITERALIFEEDAESDTNIDYSKQLNYLTQSQYKLQTHINDIQAQLDNHIQQTTSTSLQAQMRVIAVENKILKQQLADMKEQLDILRTEYEKMSLKMNNMLKALQYIPKEEGQTNE